MQRRSLAAATFCALAALVLVVPSSQAASGVPVWKCRGSATYASVAGNNRVEPIVANGKPNTANGADSDNAQCADAEVGAGNLLTPLGIQQASLGVQTASAITNITPELGTAIDQTVRSTAKVEHLNLGNVLSVQAATSGASASCSGGTPKFLGSSTVVGINSSSLDPLIQGLASLLSVVPSLVSIKINEQINTGDSLTVRALHVKVLSPSSGPPLLDLIVAESKVGFNGAVCDPSQQGPGGQICPTGSTYDIGGNVCVIDGSSGSVYGTIIIGAPYEGPTGGTVMPIDLARKKYGNSACLKGNKKPKYAIIGSNKADHITGTNKADRILARGGKDSVSGGRGNDCLDGGSGSDSLSGSLGKDRIYGRTGGDHLNGAAGTDYLSGGAGNDSINAGFGRDRVFGGSGRDLINVATAGPPARVSCGVGRDRVRVNFIERNRTRGCEVKYVFNDKRRK
jgi:Ca2+-binding RTX toxin-like protein